MAPESSRARQSATTSGTGIRRQDGIGKGAKSDATGRKTPPNDHHLRTRRGWKRTNQERQATNLVARNGTADAAMGKGGRRAAKCEKIRRAETRSAGKAAQINLKNLFKELLLLRRQETRQRGRLLARKLRAARIRYSGLRKIVGRTAERRKKRTGSASKAAA
jgi:hypothetical protein